MKFITTAKKKEKALREIDESKSRTHSRNKMRELPPEGYLKTDEPEITTYARAIK
jgi:hypothetical protein